jgi:hypothetical protein
MLIIPSEGVINHAPTYLVNISVRAYCHTPLHVSL